MTKLTYDVRIMYGLHSPMSRTKLITIESTDPDYVSHKLLLRALANETRFAIISLLKEKPFSVGEICERLGFEQSRVSHNLKCLVDCGFVNAEQDGKNRIYALDDKTVRPMLQLIEKHVERYKNHLIACRILGGE
jgi:ArsR family transcriptional regulator, zinc-responsive transcriptional repressor